jgi:type II secretory pathway component GspD/PulD (secretin)
MRTSHLTRSWGYLAAFCLGLALLAAPLTSASAGDGQDGIVLKVFDMPFNNVVKLLAQQSGLKLVMKTEVDTPVTLNFPEPTPLEQILASATTSVGLDFWRSGDVYYIGKRRELVEITPERATPAVRTMDPPTTASVPRTTTRMPDLAPATSPATVLMPAPAPAKTAETPSNGVAIRVIYLRNTPVREMAYMLGVPGYSPQDSQRKKAVRNRIESALGPRKRSINDSYNSSAYNSSSYASPALSGTVTRNGSATNGNQLFPPLPAPGGGVNPGGAAPAAPANPANPANPNGAAGANGAGGGGGLANFLPEQIQPENIIGLIGLNALLVKSVGDTKEKAEEAIDQLEQLIKLLDQPVKQVIVEVMFVKMEVKDALELGSSWEFAGMPLSVVSSNGGGEGNFAIRYLRGNLKAVLATLITNSRAKVVNAPRVVVQNGGTADITATDSIPFITVSQETDVFGRSFETPEIEFQDFDQGMTVNNVTIHPDDTVTLDVTPNLTAPSAQVGIPGGAGAVSGSSEFTVTTIVRVKNGETIMMGGFVSKNETVGGTRDPLLNSLPIVGPLFFRSNTKSTNNTETLIFVTPTIMKEDTTDFSGLSTLPPLF